MCQSTLLCVVHHCVQPLLSLLWSDVNELPSTVGVVGHHVIDGHTRVVLVDVHQLRVVCGPGRDLVVHRVQLLIELASLYVLRETTSLQSAT